MFLVHYIFLGDKFVETPEWWMTHRGYPYYRNIKTTQERRRWYYDVEGDVKLRRCRAPHFLDGWNIEKVASCKSTKSWKKLNKCRKQWQKKKFHDEQYYVIGQS